MVISYMVMGDTMTATEINEVKEIIRNDKICSNSNIEFTAYDNVSIFPKVF